ncbi:hypothetical protein [Pseudoalteromonas luteoviolacea]|uniref:hypothetical protein n=1 Tax=Pseudoalteromonas luteoviolacea TaxID=43657 RepID=UPI00114DDF27|nr:hypothetical protein [Pseudoalteromonas luteoviolacea]TQF67862.1 hypothetical protein FLM44_22030 [Pseudoalteromonas luteoviolacea]
MPSREKLISWLGANKQIGVVFDFDRVEGKYWSSVGVQKWNSVFKVYVDEILESEMDAENYAREEIVSFTSVEEAIDFVENDTNANLEQLAPCKGQKIFNPAFDNP